MQQLIALLVMFDTLDAHDSQKYQMLRKAITLLQNGKTPEEAFSFVTTVLKDGGYDATKERFSESQLISFGNYMVSDKRKEIVASLPEETRNLAHHADIKHWQNPVDSDLPATNLVNSTETSLTTSSPNAEGANAKTAEPGGENKDNVNNDIKKEEGEKNLTDKTNLDTVNQSNAKSPLDDVADAKKQAEDIHKQFEKPADETQTVVQSDMPGGDNQPLATNAGEVGEVKNTPEGDKTLDAAPEQQ